MDRLSLDLGLTDRSVIITGGAGLIGSVVVEHFLAAGAKVSSLDTVHAKDDPTDSASSGKAFKKIHCDISQEESVQEAFAIATQAHGPAEICIALASLDLSVLSHSSFAEASFAQLQNVLSVNVTGTWLTARAWFRGLRDAKQDGTALKHPNLIMIGSESGHFGERQNAEYSLGKSAVQGGLLMSLRAEAPRVWQGARVNVVAPGPVETDRWHEEIKQSPDQLYLDAQATVLSHQPFRISQFVQSHIPLSYRTTHVWTLPQIMANQHRRHFANQFPLKLSLWQSSPLPVTTSVHTFTDKL